MATNYLALDVGRARIGLAVANDIARLAAPLPALSNDEQWLIGLQEFIKQNDISVLIVGWPRNLQGDETEQTGYVGEVIERLKAAIDLPLYQQDEALTSVKAEQELEARGKPYSKGDIDSLSAVYILEDFLADAVH